MKAKAKEIEMRKEIRFKDPEGKSHWVEIAEMFVESVVTSLEKKGYAVEK